MALGVGMMLKRVRFRWLWLIAMLLSGLLGCEAPNPASRQGTGGSAQAQTAEAKVTPLPEAIPVRVAAVTRQPIASYLQGTATLESATQIDVLAKTAGLVLQVAVKEGDVVELGQVVATLDDREAQLALARARIELAEAELAYRSLVPLDHEEAELELNRMELAEAEAVEKHRKAATMQQRGLASDRDVQEAKTRRDIAKVAVAQARVRLKYKKIDNARFRYQRAQTDVQEAALHLQYTTVTAPVSGVVSALRMAPGQDVQDDAILMTIVDTQHLLARTFLPEQYSGRLKPGQTAYIQVGALPNQRVPARVQLISPVVDAESGTFKVTVALTAPPPELKPGMFTTVFMTVAQQQQALVIPKRALTLDQAEATVYRLQDGRAQLAAITLGETDGDRIEVRSGLTEGDLVVVVGQDNLLNGALVRVVDDAVLPATQ
jgi:multidrug efflux pump subunit AcrA (membrane-fusion protein)